MKKEENNVILRKDINYFRKTKIKKKSDTKEYLKGILKYTLPPNIGYGILSSFIPEIFTNTSIFPYLFGSELSPFFIGFYLLGSILYGITDYLDHKSSKDIICGKELNPLYRTKDGDYKPNKKTIPLPYLLGLILPIFFYISAGVKIKIIKDNLKIKKLEKLEDIAEQKNFRG